MQPSTKRIERSLIGTAIILALSITATVAFIVLYVVWITVKIDGSDTSYIAWPLWVLVFLLITTFSLLLATIQRYYVYRAAVRASRDIEVITVTTETQPTFVYPEYNNSSGMAETMYPEYKPPAPGFNAPPNDFNPYIPAASAPMQSPTFEPPGVYIYNREPAQQLQPDVPYGKPQ
ncbi:developmentally-regulated membrane protein [Acrasis kona]|uniref:Developmentally-regulated membrane protein n=1 Tax=Acrasis kona TaxID=1008807 RepID=A0AAW2ZR26_9EUKA